MRLEDLLRAEFPLREDIVHLNHAAVAPWPWRTVDAVTRFAEENARVGSLHYPAWLEAEAQLRAQLARLINAPGPDDIALLKNTSEALSVVAYGLDWEPGDNVVISDQEFPSNRIVWQSLAPLGVEVRQVRLDADANPEEALLAACDGRTRLLAISSVQYASGLRVDLSVLGAACRTRGILLCADAIQSVGAVATDVQAMQVDFLMADGHKWMLGPEGLALFYCRPELRERLQLRQYGWHMVEHQDDFERHDWQPAASARRFECGSPNMLGIQALSASVSLLLEVGMQTVERRVLDNAEFLLERLRGMSALELLSDARPGRYAGIVTFRHRDNQELYARLRDKGVLCALRGGGIRFSPHFHTSRESMERALACLD